MVYPQKKLGIVFAPANDKGEVGVQIQKGKFLSATEGFDFMCLRKDVSTGL